MHVRVGPPAQGNAEEEARIAPAAPGNDDDTATRAEIEQLRCELQAQINEVKEFARRQKQHAAEKIEDGEEKCGGNRQTIYAYAEHTILNGTPLQVADALLRLTLVSTIATMLAYAFFDASWLNDQLGNKGYPAFDEIIYGNFYNFNGGTNPDTGTPTIAIISGVLGVALMCVFVRAEDVETLSAPFPVGVLLCHSELFHGRQLWRAVAQLMLQFLWTLRAQLIPVFALVGTVHALAGTDKPADIVLNTLAAAFLMELDGQLYSLLVSASRREAYEAAPATPMSPMGTRGAEALCENYSWLLFLPSIAVGGVIFVQGDHRSFEVVFRSLEYLFMLRAAIAGVGHAHVALRVIAWRRVVPHASAPLPEAMAARPAHSRARLVLVLKLLSIVGLSIFLGWVSYRLLFRRLLDSHFGFYYNDNDPCLRACLRSWPSEIDGGACFGRLVAGTCEE